jgi:uncharacterized protein
MNPNQALTEDEFDELDAFLMSEETPDECMDFSTLDGFLAAVVLTPEMILPSQWLPWVWDMEKAEDSPKFASIEEAGRISGYIMRHYNTVMQSINEGWFDPLLIDLVQPDESEFLDAEGWCAGFMLGITLFGDAWQTVREKHIEMVAPMMLLGTEDGWDILKSSDDEKRSIQDAYEAIPTAVAVLHAHFKPQRDQVTNAHVSGAKRITSADTSSPFKRGDVKIGRNDPCPCGSGKKYKKCCGAETLH